MKQHIIDCVCRAYEVSEDELRSKSRHRKYVYARYAAMKLLYKYAQPISTHQVGKLLNKDHSTVVYGIKIVKESLLHMDYPDFSGSYYIALMEVTNKFNEAPVKLTDKIVFYLQRYKGRDISPAQMSLVEDVSEAVQVLTRKDTKPTRIASLEPVV